MSYFSPEFEPSCARARRLLSGLFRQDGYVRFNNFLDLEGYLIGQQGLQFLKAESLILQGKDTLYIQFFYHSDLLWVRLKNQPRFRTPNNGQMNVVLATGPEWDEELSKFDRFGNLVSKVDVLKICSEAGDFRSLQRVGRTMEELERAETPGATPATS